MHCDVNYCFQKRSLLRERNELLPFNQEGRNDLPAAYSLRREACYGIATTRADIIRAMSSPECFTWAGPGARVESLPPTHAREWPERYGVRRGGFQVRAPRLAIRRHWCGVEAGAMPDWQLAPAVVLQGRNL